MVFRFVVLAPLCVVLSLSCASFGSGTVVKAEEYFSLGGAYFELGKYDEAERWYRLARSFETTRPAAEYQLGRVAFARGEPEEAARRFEALLERDERNAVVLRAAAYSWMKAERWDRALELYGRLEALLPETVDARYNYALALSSAERFDEAAERLRPAVERDPEDRDAALLMARIEARRGRPEAADHFAAALALKDEPSVRMEYGELLEKLELYALALENYQAVMKSGAEAAGGKGAVRFRIARTMLFAGEDPERMLAELAGAVADGFADADAIAALARSDAVSAELKERILAAVPAPSSDSLVPPGPEAP